MDLYRQFYQYHLSRLEPALLLRSGTGEHHPRTGKHHSGTGELLAAYVKVNRFRVIVAECLRILNHQGQITSAAGPWHLQG